MWQKSFMKESWAAHSLLFFSSLLLMAYGILVQVLLMQFSLLPHVCLSPFGIQVLSPEESVHTCNCRLQMLLEGKAVHSQHIFSFWTEIARSTIRSFVLLLAVQSFLSISKDYGCPFSVSELPRFTGAPLVTADLQS